MLENSLTDNGLKPRNHSKASVFYLQGEKNTQPFTRVLQRVVASLYLLFGDTHTYNLLLYFMCRDLGYIMSMPSSTYLGSVKITIRVETTFFSKTQLSLSPLSSLWGFDIWWPLWPWHLCSDNKQTFQTFPSCLSLINVNLHVSILQVFSAFCENTICMTTLSINTQKVLHFILSKHNHRQFLGHSVTLDIGPDDILHLVHPPGEATLRTQKGVPLWCRPPTWCIENGDKAHNNTRTLPILQ